VVSRIGLQDAGEISRLTGDMGPVRPADRTLVVSACPMEERIAAPPGLPADPAGYFVIDISADNDIIRLEHHAPDHRVTAVLVGGSARDLYLAAIRRGLVSRIDHAAYLGYELGRAERALRLKTRYIQDRPDPQGRNPR